MSTEGVTVSSIAAVSRITYRDVLSDNICPKVITRTYAVTNACGKTATCERQLIFIDNTAPQVAGIPQDVTVECNDIPNLPAIRVQDNCDERPDRQFNEVRDYNACGGTITRTWTITDKCGNSIERKQIITVLPAPVPTIDADLIQSNITSNCELPEPKILRYSNGEDGICNLSGEVTSIDVLIDTANLTYERIWDAGLDQCGRQIPIITQIIQLLPYKENIDVPANAKMPDDGEAFCDIYLGENTDKNKDGRFNPSEWADMDTILQEIYNTQFGDIFCTEEDTLRANIGELIVHQQYQIIQEKCKNLSAKRRYRIYPASSDNLELFPWVEQNITIKYKANWVIKFPEDYIGECTDEFPPPHIELASGFCDFVNWTYEEETFRGLGQCYKMLRTYRVVNDCQYVPGATPAFIIPRRENHHKMVFGDSVSHVSAIDEIDEMVLGDYGVIEYVQVIKFGTSEAPKVSVDSIELCLTSGSNFEEETDCGKETQSFSVSATSCGASEDDLFRFEWTIFENEEMVGSGLGNQFEWEVSPKESTGISYRVNWNVFDNCGNKTQESRSYEFIDCKLPTPICLHGVSVDLSQNSKFAIWPTDINKGSFDNCTDSENLILKMWHISLSEEAPTTVDAVKALPDLVTFDCNYLGTQEVYLYVVDIEDNFDYCVTYVNVQDNFAYCNNIEPIDRDEMATLSGKILDFKEALIEGVYIRVVDNTNNSGEVEMTTDATGEYAFELPKLETYEIVPEKDVNPLNGVTTFDLVLIAKHILGIKPFTSPHQLIASDVNRSGSITAFDMVQIRRLILQLDTTFPNNTSWRFVPNDPKYFNMDSSFLLDLPASIEIVNHEEDLYGLDFRGIKIGDVNTSATSNSLMFADERSNLQKVAIKAQDQWLKKGMTFTVAFHLENLEKMQGFQFGLNYNGLTINHFKQGVVAENHVNLDYNSGSILLVSWDKSLNPKKTTSNNANKLFTLEMTVLEDGLLSEKLSILDRWMPVEVFDQNNEFFDLTFEFEQPEETKFFDLLQNRPNPFNQTTVIGVNLPSDDEVELIIRSETGQVLKSIKQSLKKGFNEITFNSQELPVGVYFYQLNSKFGVKIKKMIITY